MYISKRAMFATLFAVIISNSNVSLAAKKSDRHFDKESQHTSTELLVKFKNSSQINNFSQSALQSLGNVKTTPLVSKHNSRTQKLLGHDRNSNKWLIVHIPQGQSIDRYRKTLLSDPNIEYVEYNYRISTFVAPNDPLYPEMWNLENTGQTGGRVDADIDASSAWDIQTGNSSIVVAVIDTGVDYNHPDLRENIWSNQNEIAGNGIDDDGNGYVDDTMGYDFVDQDNDPMDTHGHGTHVSGIIAAEGGNGIGIAGVAWNIKIMPLRFLNDEGQGTTTAAIEAIYYATNMGVKISNNSWGSLFSSQALKEAIDFANAAGSLFVAAAGNLGNNIDISLHYPAAYDVDNIISVAASDHFDSLARFSNYGVIGVDLVAPGVNIISTVPRSGNGCCSRFSGYMKLSGTSMASPHVAGALALLASSHPEYNYLELKAKILSNVDRIKGHENVSNTAGRLNIANVLSDSDEITPGQITDLTSNDVQHRSAQLSWTSVGDDDDIGSATRYDIRFSESSIDSSNFYFATQATNSMTPSLSGSMESYVLKGLEPDTLYFVAIISIDNSGNESELSNIVSFTTRPQPNAMNIDYSVRSLKATKQLSRGDIVQATDSVCQNQFEANGLVKHSALYLSTDPVITKGDTIIATRRIDTAPNECDSGTYWAIMPSASLGTYYIGSIADYQNIEREANDHNNNSTVQTIELIDGLADLTAEIVSVKEQVTPGEAITVNSNICNMGTKSSGDFSYAAYLSTDPTITTNDTLLNSVRHILYNEHCTGLNNKLSVDIPSDLMVGGTYYIGIISDIDDDVVESNENNNGSLGIGLTIIEPVDDLVFTEITGPTRADTGSTVSITGELCNLISSRVPSQFGSIYLLSDNNIITENDQSVGWHYNGLADSWCTSTLYAVATIPTDLAPGTYYWGAVVNSFGLVPELSKDNNWIIGNTVIIK